MKKQFFVVLIFSFTTLNAALSQPPNANFKGIYGGGNLGGSFTTAYMDAMSNGMVILPNNGFILESIFSSNSALKKDSLKGGLLGGYGYNWQRVYIGGEVFINTSKYQMQSTINDGGREEKDFETQTTLSQVHIKFKSVELGFDLRPGLLLTPSTLLFARIGKAFNRISLNMNSNTQDTFTGPIAIPESLYGPSSFIKNKYIHPLRLGAGIEQKISEHLAIRADYIFTNYGSIIGDSSQNTNQNSENFGSGTIKTNNNARARLINNTITLGLSYYLPDNGLSIDDIIKAKENNYFDGFYVGGSGGGAFTTANTDISAATTVFFPMTFNGSQTQMSFFAQTAELKNNAFKANLYSGYGMSWNKLYLGSEIFTSLSSTNMKGSGTGGELGLTIDGVLQEEFTSNSIVNVKQKSLGGGIDLRPGFLLTQSTLMYGRVGIAMNQISIMANNSSMSNFFAPAFPGSPSFPVNVNASKSKTVTPMRLGLGTEQFITPHLAIRADYIHTKYPTINVNQSMFQDIPEFNPIIGSGTVSADENAKVKLTNNTVLLGFSYYFQ